MKLFEKTILFIAATGCIVLGIFLFVILFEIFREFHQPIQTGWTSPENYFIFLTNLIVGINLVQIGFACRLVSCKDRFLVISRKMISAEIIILECIFVVLPAMLFFQIDMVGLILIGFSLAVLSFYVYGKKISITSQLPFQSIASAVFTIVIGIVVILMPILQLFWLPVPEVFIISSDWLVVVGIMLLLCANFLCLFSSTRRLCNAISLAVAILGFCSVCYSMGSTRHFANTMNSFLHKRFLYRRMKNVRDPLVLRDFDIIEENFLLNLKFHPHSHYSAYIWLALGDIHELRGNKEKALEFYRKAFLELDRYERLFSSYGKRDIINKVKALEHSLNAK